MKTCLLLFTEFLARRVEFMMIGELTNTYAAHPRILLTLTP